MDASEVEPTLMEVASGLPDEGSLLDSLKKARQEAAEQQTVDIKLPGYERSNIRLYARYQLMDGKELTRIGQRVAKEFRNKQYETALYGSIDVIIAACLGFYYEDESGERKELTYGGAHITGYNQALADAFNITVDPGHPARSIVLGMFDGNDIALSTHNMKLGRWMGDTSIDVDEEFLGNP